MNTTKTTNVTESISHIVEKDCANFASLLDLLVEHPDIQSHKILMGSVSAIKSQFVEVWDKLEAEVDAINDAQAV